jgi:hypothetical protein
MRSEIIQIAAYANYDGFQYVLSFILNKNSFHYLKDYLITKLTPGKVVGIGW